jgi:hypothetical protein
LTKTNKLDKALVRLQRRNVEDSCYNIWNLSGNITIDIAEIRRIMSTIQHYISAPYNWVTIQP